MFIVRNRSHEGCYQRIRLPYPTDQVADITRRRRGLTLIELLLVLSMLACVLLVTQCLQEHQPPVPAGGQTYSWSVEDDLSPILGVVISPDQQDVISIGTDSRIRVHNLESRNCSAEIENKQRVSQSICYSPDGSQLLVGSLYGAIEVWSMAANPPTSVTIAAHGDNVRCCLFSPDGTRFVTCGDDWRCIVWNAKILTPISELPRVSATIRQACFLPDGTRLLTGDVNGHLHLWDLVSGQLIRKIDVAGAYAAGKSFIEGIAVLPGKSEVLVALRDGRMEIWQLDTGNLRMSFQAAAGKLKSLSLSRDGVRAISGHLDGWIHVWEVATGTCLQSFAAHAGPVQALTLTNNSQLAVSAGWDGELKFWPL